MAGGRIAIMVVFNDIACLDKECRWYRNVYGARFGQASVQHPIRAR